MRSASNVGKHFEAGVLAVLACPSRAANLRAVVLTFGCPACHEYSAAIRHTPSLIADHAQ
jgi:hypothetical protein